jgi:rod shape-determining protein MreC
MPRNLTHQAKSLLLVVLLLLLWWFTPSFVKRGTEIIFGEFQAPAWTGMSYLKDLRSYWTNWGSSKEDLISAGMNLSRLNAAYVVRNQQVDSMERELRRLEGYFNLPSYPEYQYEVARVIKRDLTAWWQVLVIRKGLNYGIEPGQAVIFSGGVVGRIQSVGAYTSTVELISSPHFRAAGHFESDDRPVEFRGGINPGLRAATGTVSTVPAELVASRKDPVRLTSSKLGGIFPDGLTIGWVYNLEPSSDGLFQAGKVMLDPRLQSLREVAVLIPIEARGDPGR